MTIETQQVHWQGRYLSPDSVDPGDEPDVLPLEGTVNFLPVWDERISGFLSDSLSSIHVRTFAFELRDGKLMSRDGEKWIDGVKIPSRVGGVTLSWVVKFDVKAKGNQVPVRDISFESNPGGVVSLVDMVPAEAIYPRFSPDVVRGDSVEDVFVQGDYLVFLIGTGARMRQKMVQLPWPTEASLDQRYLRPPPEPKDGQILSWDAASGGWVAIDPPSGSGGGIQLDTDGVPYFTPGGDIKVDTDGVPYF